MKIAAGSAGLATLSHCTSGAYDCKVVCHEKTDRVGCTWVYREETGSGWFKDTHEHVQKLKNESSKEVRFVLKFRHGKKDLPSEVDMLREEKAELEKREMEGLQKMHFHMMGPKHSDYYDDLAGITPLPPVFANPYNENSAGFLNDFLHYREKRYRIIDDYNYSQH